VAYTYPHPRPALTADVVLLTDGTPPQVLLIRRGHPPYQEAWALPGGFVDEGEALEAAAARELLEETGIEAPALTQIGAYGDPGRDPRGWVVSVAFRAQADRTALTIRAGDDATEARWWPVDAPPMLAFDHARILADALRSQRATQTTR